LLFWTLGDQNPQKSPFFFLKFFFLKLHFLEKEKKRKKKTVQLKTRLLHGHIRMNISANQHWVGIRNGTKITQWLSKWFNIYIYKPWFAYIKAYEE
jgi:hypothetical protein